MDGLRPESCYFFKERRPIGFRQHKWRSQLAKTQFVLKRADVMQFTVLHFPTLDPILPNMSAAYDGREVYDADFNDSGELVGLTS